MIEKQLEEINTNIKAILVALLALNEKFVNVNAPPAVLLPKDAEVPAGAKPVKAKKEKEEKLGSVAEPETAPETGSQRVVTRAQVGAALCAICEAAGSADPGKAILTQFGVPDLASLPEAKYAEMLAACEKAAKPSTSNMFA